MKDVEKMSSLICKNFNFYSFIHSSQKYDIINTKKRFQGGSNETRTF